MNHKTRLGAILMLVVLTIFIYLYFCRNRRGHSCVIPYIYVITLHDPSDTTIQNRGIASMRSNLREYGMDHAVPLLGVDARDPQLVPESLKAKFPNINLIGAVGCYLAHVKALNQAASLSNPNDPVLIMEDDAVIRKPIDNLPNMNKYDIVFLGHCYELLTSSSENGYQDTVQARCLHGYVVTPRSARKILSLLKAPDDPTPYESIDTELEALIRSTEICAASSNPARIFQRAGSSDIGLVSGCPGGICYVNPDAY